MDGTLAKFYENAFCVRDHETEGFFRNLLPYDNMVEAFKQLWRRDDIRAYILSSVGSTQGEEEKEAWILKHFRETQPIGCFFCRPGQSKAEYIRSFYNELTPDDILLDDYSKNLVEWEKAGGTGIKVLNDLNGRGWNGTNFDGASISVDWTGEEIARAVVRIIGLPVNAPQEPATLTVMCGLPGSGKSTIAATMCAHDKDLVLVSSDGIRKEIYGNEAHQADPKEVFAIANQRARDALQAGKSVVFDATNVYYGSRKQLLESIPRDKGISVRFWVVDTPVEECLRRNAARDRKVPEESIRRYAKRFSYPSKGEWPYGPCVVTKCRV